MATSKMINEPNNIISTAIEKPSHEHSAYIRSMMLVEVTEAAKADATSL